jgi:hypothetical protein
MAYCVVALSSLLTGPKASLWPLWSGAIMIMVRWADPSVLNLYVWSAPNTTPSLSCTYHLCVQYQFKARLKEVHSRTVRTLVPSSGAPNGIHLDPGTKYAVCMSKWSPAMLASKECSCIIMCTAPARPPLVDSPSRCALAPKAALTVRHASYSSVCVCVNVCVRVCVGVSGMAAVMVACMCVSVCLCVRHAS